MSFSVRLTNLSWAPASENKRFLEVKIRVSNVLAMIICDISYTQVELYGTGGS